MTKVKWKKRLIFLMVILLLFAGNAYAIDILPKDGLYTPQEAPEEPIVTPEPMAVLIGEEREDLVDNGFLQDRGTVWLYWNGSAFSKYGCSIADIGYTNPTKSNIGVTFQVAIYDGNLIKYFGTTFREDSEVDTLALNGLEALENGIDAAAAEYLILDGELFEGMTVDEVITLERSAIAQILADKEFLGMDYDELMALDTETVLSFSELERLEVARLGGYNYFAFTMEIGRAGLINPGYALYQVELHTLPNRVTLPKGEYEVVYILNGYDSESNKMSDFFVHLTPITLYVQDDVPEDLIEEYGIVLATRIDK